MHVHHLPYAHELGQLDEHEAARRPEGPTEAGGRLVRQSLQKELGVSIEGDERQIEQPEGLRPERVRRRVVDDAGA